MFKATDAQTPDEYIDRLEEPRRTDIKRLHGLIRKTAPDLEPHIASGMLAHGRCRYRSKSGSQGDWFHIGLASNKRYISLYWTGTLEPATLGETDVVAVSVGEQDRAHVFQHASHSMQCRRDQTPIHGQAGVHDRDSPCFLDQVALDDLVADPVNSPNFRRNH